MFGVLRPVRGVTCSVIRLTRLRRMFLESGVGTFSVPTITMNAAHSVGDVARTQYFLTNTLISGSVNSITAESDE